MKPSSDNTWQVSEKTASAMLAWPKPAQRWSAAQDRQQENSIPPLWSWLSQGSLNFNRSFDACIFGHNSKYTVMVVFVYFFGSVVTVAAVMPWILCVECGKLPKNWAAGFFFFPFWMADLLQQNPPKPPFLAKQHFQFDIWALYWLWAAQWADYRNTCGERNNAASKVNIIKLTG